MKKQATCVYPARNGKLLFLVRNKKDDQVHKQGIYLPIGGKVEIGEAVEDCARREVLEEAGITLISLNLKGVVYIRGQNNGEDDWINFIFISKNFTGKPTKGSEGYFEWIDLKDIKNINTYTGDKIYLQYMQKYNFFIADFLYKGFGLLKSKLLVKY